MRRRSVAGVLASVVVTAMVTLGVAAGPAASVATAQPAASASGVELRLSALEPRIVTATGPDKITVTGVLVNTGNDAVRDLVVRLQRSDTLSSESAIRTALSGDEPADAVTPNFTALAAELAPGAELPISITVALRGAPGSSLALQRAGTYELLVNVNGVADGEPARLASGRMLLPVLELPAAPGVPATAPARAATPLGTSVLYPLADLPRRRPTGPGEPLTLTDDELATSLEPSGRLGGLVTALEQKAPPGSRIRTGVCLAVDPELLQTVRLMASGYRVQAADGAQSDGRGATAAGRWLDSLRAAAKGTCVIALPLADADLVALSRNSLADLGALAVQKGSQVAATVLGTPVVAQATHPAEGVLDNRALLDYTTAGGHAVLLAADNVVTAGSGSSASAGTVRLPAGAAPGQPAAPHAVLTDPLLTLATATSEPTPGGPDGSDRSTNVGSGGIDQGVTSAATAPALAGQDAIGTLAFRAAGTPSARSTTAGPQVLAPPHRWNLNEGEAAALLDAFDTLVGAGRLAPQDLSAALTAEPAPTASTGRLVYPPPSGGREVPASVATEVRLARDSAADLLSAAVNEPGVAASPGQVFEPVTESMVAAVSAAWRGRPELATAAADAVTERVDLLRSAVRVVEPPAPYALASEKAPLALTLANGLPVAMNVRVELSGTAGLRTAPIPVQRVPALGRLQLRVNTEVSRSGQFTVYATVSTPGGSQLGQPSRLLVNSSAYGTITLWLTGTAGVLLVLLAGRRIIRRIRRRPEHADPPSDPMPPVTTPPAASDPHPSPGPSPSRDPSRETGRPRTLGRGQPPSPSPGPPRDPVPSPSPSTSPSPTPSPSPSSPSPPR